MLWSVVAAGQAMLFARFTDAESAVVTLQEGCVIAASAAA